VEWFRLAADGVCVGVSREEWRMDRMAGSGLPE